MRGSFENDVPVIELGVSGVLADSPFQKIQAIVDTGFNGYLSLPYVTAFPLGLVLTGMKASTVATGERAHHFVCIGKVKVGEQEVLTPIDIQPNCPVLLGTLLMKRLQKSLHVDFEKQKVSFS